MKINIVRPTDGWVLQEIAEGWKLPNSKCSTLPDVNADVNIWVNYAMFKSAGKMRKTKCDIGWFTHREEGPLGEVFDNVARSMDWCIAMSRNTWERLPKKKVTVIHTAPRFRSSPIKIGVVGREYPRKRGHLMSKVTSDVPRVCISFTNGNVDESNMEEFYRSMDYILVLSSLEGGPMCVPEAMALGKPVIAPNVGWCWDYPVIRYGSEDDLIRVLRKLTPPTIEEESGQIMRVIKEVVK